MSKATNRPDIESLLAERARYDGWIALLASRPVDAPSHVVERVRSDYERRLAGIREELLSRSDELHGEASVLAGRVADLAARHHNRMDARAEDELRAFVGELDENTWRVRSAEHDAAIKQVLDERSASERDLSRIQALLEDVSEPAAGEIEARVPERRPPAAWDVTDLTAPAQAEAPLTPHQPPQQRRQPPPEAGIPSGGEPIPRSSLFDELAFLNAVPARTPPHLAQGVPRSAPTPSYVGTIPPGPQVSAPHTVPAEPKPVRPEREPIHRDAVVTPTETKSAGAVRPPSDPERSLKCQECGWSNLSTEWYCEKCGGELSAF